MKSIIRLLEEHKRFVFYSLSVIVVSLLIYILMSVSFKYYQMLMLVVFSFYIIKALYLFFIETRYDWFTCTYYWWVL